MRRDLAVFVFAVGAAVALAVLAPRLPFPEGLFHEGASGLMRTFDERPEILLLLASVGMGWIAVAAIFVWLAKSAWLRMNVALEEARWQREIAAPETKERKDQTSRSRSRRKGSVDHRRTVTFTVVAAPDPKT